MGIFDALTTSVAGLQAQSFALQNISGNVANSETTGYKETDTSFEDMVSRLGGADLRQWVIANSVATNTVQGTLKPRVSTDMAINGNGYFVVAQPTGSVDNQPMFSGVSDCTRAGDFQLNSGRKSGQRRRLLSDGYSDRRRDSEIRSAVRLRSLQFNNDFIPAQATTAIQYQANLPSTPSSGMIVGTDFEANPLAGAPAAAVITGSGATLQPDAIAQLTGNVSLTGATTLVVARNNRGRPDNDQRRNQYADDLHRAGRGDS